MKHMSVFRATLIAAVILTTAMGLSLAGCGGEAAETTSTVFEPAGSATSAEAPATASETIAPPVATPFVEPSYLDPQPVDLAAIVNLDDGNLTDAQKQVLARQSFVAAAQSPGAQPWKFWQTYEDARYRGLPLLVTTDSVLNAYHGLFDTLLQRLEERALYDQALEMTAALYEAALNQCASATDATVHEDAVCNIAYFAVAQALLTGQLGTVPGVVDADGGPADLEAALDLAELELPLIEAAERVGDSPILGYREDYTQYKPRGHYTRSETLQRYFKASMWYGHTGFFINPRPLDIEEEEAMSLTRRAILISSALVGEAKQAWSAIYEPTSFLVGRADDLTVDEIEGVLSQVFGTAQPEPDALADDARITVVREKLNELRAPKILTAPRLTAGDTENREENERSFRVMGQRYIPDSYAFQQLVWPYVGEDIPEDPEAKRDLPMGLDAMTVLGSDQAYTIATQDFNQNRFKNWQTQIEKVYEEFSSRDPDLWPANLYTGWLESLQQVMTLPADSAPDFMKSRVWARKSLNTALGSWTELRHDTILYAKQSITAEGGGGEEPTVPGYVEPYPAFYAKIGELAGTLRAGLLEYDLIDSESANKLEMMIWLADILKSAADKELAGESLSLEEETTIAEYGHYLEMLEQFDDEEEGRTLAPTAEKCPVVADVHSSYNTLRALEEGTGYPLTLYAAFEVNGELRLFAGASYAYYEFTVPLDKRMTDEEWIAALDSGQAPPRPAWTDEWIVAESAQ